MFANRSAPPGVMVPNLCYPDVEAAVTWLCETFGFREVLRWGPEASPAVQLVLGEGAVFVRGPRESSATAGAAR